MSGTIDLSQLPAPAVIESLDFETLFAERKAALIALYPADEQAAVAATLALESEPIVKILQENAYRELVLRQRINESAEAVMLARAGGADLDQLAANYNVARFTLQSADSTAVPPVAAVMESDADLRARAQQAFEGLSVAGPRAAYIAHALSADSRVADVSAESPAPCEAVVTVLSREGNGTANATLLAIVAAALNDDDVRPVGDRVTVQGAAIVNYVIDAALYVYPGPEAEPIRAAALTKLAAYIGTQRRIGRDIRRSAIYAALHVEGVQRVELASPAADIVLDSSEAAYCTGYAVTVAGSDE
jgi:phage-related baseplate assembly protein